jgi:hypothetical protein
MLIILCSICAHSIAQTPPEEKEQSPSGKATIAIEVIDERELRLYDTISFYVKLSVDKNADSVDISSVTASPQGPAAYVYASGKDVDCQLNTSSVAPAETAIIATCVLYQRNPSIHLNLLMRPKTDVLASVAVTSSGSRPQLVTAPITLKPPIYAPYFGGFIGAMMLACLAGLWKVRASDRLPKIRNALSGEMPFSKSAQLVFLEAISLVFGLILYVCSEWGFATITSFVFIVIGQGTSLAGAPIQLTVTDFWGGVTIGLFAFPLNKWLLTRLGLDLPKGDSI